MKSMTGFGSGTASNDNISVTVELRAVNQRFLELSIRMPHAYLSLEDILRNTVKASLHRGKVDVFITVQDIIAQAPKITINYESLEACKNVLDEASQKLFGTATTLSQISSLTKDWFIQEPADIDIDSCVPVFTDALKEALDGITHMREVEGANIKKDLLKRIDFMSDTVEKIAAKKEVIMQHYEERLQKRITDLVNKAGKIPDEDRLLQEVAVYADKVDFTEEIVRFRSHVLQLRKLVDEPGDIGRKLDFLIQELNREVNTIGSKANDLDVTEYVLQLKNELEKVREQIQNIE